MYQNKKRIIIFVLLVLLFLVPISYMYGINKNPLFLTCLMVTPSLASLITRFITKEGFNNFNVSVNLKKHWKIYLKAYFLPPVLMIFGTVLFFVLFPNLFDPLHSEFALKLGVTSLNGYAKQLAFYIPLAICINPIMGLIQCFGEEFAWRGYLLPKLIQEVGVQKGILFNGILWGIWHSPIIYTGFNYGKSKSLIAIGAMIIFCIIIGNICSILFLKTKSVIAPTIFHASINATDLYAPSALFMGFTPNLLIGPNLIGLIGGLGFLLYSFYLTTTLRAETKLESGVHKK